MNRPTRHIPWYRYWARSPSEAADDESPARAPHVPDALEHGARDEGDGPRAAARAPVFHVEHEGTASSPAGAPHPEPLDGASPREDPPDHASDGPRTGDAPSAGVFHVEQGPEDAADHAPEESRPEDAPSAGVFHVEQGPEDGADHAAEAFHVEPPDEAARGGAPPARPMGEELRPGRMDPHFDRAQVLTIANQKGGVGKTTTAVSVSAALADLGCRVLLVDLDPQGNATSGVGVRVPPNHPTIYDVLVGDVEIEDAIEPTSVRNLFVVPSNLDLAGAEIELVSAFSREQKLRRALETVRSEYDIVLIDCPPSLGLLTVNALCAGDGLLVPIQCEYYALEGLGALRRNADLIRSQLNPDLDITGFVLTMLDARTRLSQQVVDEVRAHFGDRVFTTRIPRSVRLAEAPGFGQPITVFDPGSRGALAYRRLAAELLERLMTNDGRPPPERQTEGAPV